MNAVTETPSTALARVIQPIDEPDASSLRASFEPMFAALERWQGAARDIQVTDEKQLHTMKTARALRLEIKSARVALDKKRKDMKASITSKARAVDGAFAIFENCVAPLEKHLLEQETYGERAAKARSDALQSARSAALTALGVSPLALPADLANLTDEEWLCIITDAQEAKAARDEMTRQAEVARAKREQEQRAENERLRAEKAERDKKIAELGAVEIKSPTAGGPLPSQETPSNPTGKRGQGNETDLAVQRDKPGETGAVPANDVKTAPTKAKYFLLVEALKQIANRSPEHAHTLARMALEAVGEKP
jgi:hypothetical protein